MKPRTIGEVLMLLSFLYFSLFLSLGISLDWIKNFTEYGDEFVVFGFAMIGCLLGTLIAIILYFLRKHLVSAALAVICYLGTTVIANRAVQIAEKEGWIWTTYGLQHTDISIANIWNLLLSANIIPAALLLLLALTKFFSHDEIALRKSQQQQ